MFPAMRVKIAGLDPHQQYYIAMDIVPVDNKRYRYVPHTDAGTGVNACADIQPVSSRTEVPLWTPIQKTV